MAVIIPKYPPMAGHVELEDGLLIFKSNNNGFESSNNAIADEQLIINGLNEV